jgi:dipeptidyl aminopeptidase/acylaminoacyl peptidase
MPNPNFLGVFLLLFTSFFALASAQPKLTLDEFFNAVAFTSVQLSPDGRSVVIATESADWDQSLYRRQLWLYRDAGPHAGSLTALTASGRDSAPQWSPDGRWIAFLSQQRPGKSGACDSEDETAQLYLASSLGGKAFPVTRGAEAVHAFAWSADAHALFFATRQPWSKAQKEAHASEWKDVCQYRGAERGDTIFRAAVDDARRHRAGGVDVESPESVLPDFHPLAKTPWRVQQLAASPDGRQLAFVTTSVSQREEKVEEFEIYSIEPATASPEHPPHQLTRNQAVEQNLRWDPDGKRLFFQVEYGSVEGKYQDLQIRLYSLDADTGETRHWAGAFEGQVAQYAIAAGGGVLACGRLGTEVQLYSQPKSDATFSRQAGWAGTYEHPASATHSPRIAFVYSSIDKPMEVYLAESADKLQDARAITSFNKLLTERDLPKGKPYRWTADDGTTVEGMLLYPPGQFEARHLPMFVLIHGGPNDADGNRFAADWYQWDRLAATQGWLVFEPNYRGSTGYGDKFLLQMVPEIVSRPGKDILEGVDALVKDGIADPDRLAVGGYSYGGYMTNWLITQTTRFKAAVTGAGAVEHAANWGNDDTTFDDAYLLGGLPWEASQRYVDQAALFQIDNVRTPTLIVAGADDIRVAVLEQYLLDRALHVLGVPSELLIFPGEGHALDQNPWHGKIKVREELKWLQKYGGVP